MRRHESRYDDFSDKSTLIVIASLVGVGIVGIVGFAVWANMSNDVDCSVTDASWTYTTRVDRYQVVTREGFNVQNGAFDVHNWGPRYHHDEPEVYYSFWDGKWKTRMKPVYRDWFQWKIWDWQFNRNVVESSHDLSEAWFSNPDKVALNVNLSKGEQERANTSAQYDLVCQDVHDSKWYTLHPGSLDELRNLKAQRYHVLTVPHMGEDVTIKR